MIGDLLNRSVFIFILVAAGAFARKRRIITPDGLTTLSNLLVSIAYPAVVLAAMMEIKSRQALASNIALPLISAGMMLLGFAVGLVVLPLLAGRESPSTRQTILFHCMVNNYLFMALPIAGYLYGKEGILALSFMNIGANLVLTTLGFWTLGGLKQKWDNQAWKRILNPPLVAVLAGLAIVIFWPVESRRTGWTGILLHDVFHTLGGMTIPVAMIFTGASMVNTSDTAPLKKPVFWTVVALRLLIIPVITLFLLTFIPLSHAAKGTCMISAVMPSAIASSAYTRRFGGDQVFNDWLVTVTTAFSLVTVPVILIILKIS